MVPVTVQDLLLGDAEAVLARRTEGLAGGSSYDRALHSWLTRRRTNPGDAAIAAALAEWKSSAARSYVNVAMLAVGVVSTDSEETRQAFREGFDWILGAAPDLDGTPVGLAADPTALLVVAVALRTLKDEGRMAALRQWLVRVHESYGPRFDPWERAQQLVAAKLLGGALQPDMTTAAPQTAIEIALGETVSPTSEQARMVIAACLAEASSADAITAAYLVSAMSEIRRTAAASIPVNACTVDDVLRLLRALPRALQEWTWETRSRTKGAIPRRWDIENEYHVQNLLWAVLAPVFSDLKREESTVQLGPLQPRLDLGIPCLRTIVEAKFVRRSDTLKDVIKEIAEDASLYFVDGSQYDGMIAVIWDDGQRSEQHDGIVAALEQLPRVKGAVVIARPGKMTIPAAAVLSAG